MNNLLRTILVLTITLMGGFMTGCATQKVAQDFNPATDFRDYKRFQWGAMSSSIDNTDNRAIQQAIENALIEKGFVLTQDKADVIMNVSIFKQVDSGTSTGFGVSIGLPLGNHGALGVGTNKLLNNKNNETGMIVLDMTAEKSHQLIWRGTASGVPLSNFMLRNTVKLNDTLKKLVGQLPSP